MADIIHVPFRTTRVTAHGYTYEILEIAHTYRSAEATVVEVDASVISAKHLESSGQTAVTITLDSSTDTTLWTKTVSIPATSASGNYVVVLRHAGEAGGFKGDL
jgi:hypothetical protein